MNLERIYSLIRNENLKKLTESESSELADFEAQHPADYREIKMIFDHSSGLSFPDEHEVTNEWQRVKNELVANPEAGRNIKNGRIRTRRLLSIAASFLLVAAAIFVWNSNRDDIITSDNNLMEQQLQDGSHIFMNGSSIVQIHNGFNESHRNLEMEGEIYVEAEKADFPMEISTPSMTIRVLGTRFNVMDYAEEHISSLSLFEGRVRLTLPSGQKIELDAGNHISFNKRTGTYSQYAIESERPGWTSDDLIFDNVAFEEVFVILSREFDVKFEQVEILDGLHFNDKSGDKDLKSILAKIQKTTGVSIKKVNDRLYRITR